MSSLVFSMLVLAGMATGQMAAAQVSTYAQAEALVRSHQWEEGLAILRPLLEREPHNLKALNLAGLASIGHGDTQQANKYFEKALGVDPAFVPALKNLSINEFNLQQYPGAEKHLRAAQKITPEDQTIGLYLGEILYRKKEYKSAEEQLSGAQDLVARSPVASAHLAVSYLSTNDGPKALAVLNTLRPEDLNPPTELELALALDQAGLTDRAIPYLEAARKQAPDSYAIGVDLMIANLAAKRFSEAIETGNALIASGQETAEVNDLLAQAFEGNAEIQKAFDAYRRAIALNPKDEENYLDLASLCMNQHSLQAGMKVVEVGLMSHPKSERLVFLRGVLHAMQDDFDEAERDFKLAGQLAPANDLGSIGLGEAYLENGHSEQAIPILRKRLRDNPDDASLLYLLGESLMRTGASQGSPAYVEAQNDFERSTRINANLCLPHISLGTMYLEQDRAKDAAAQFEQARSIDRTERATYSHLAVAYKRLGEPEKAKEALGTLKSLLNQEHQNAIEQMNHTAAGTAAKSAEDIGKGDRIP